MKHIITRKVEVTDEIATGAKMRELRLQTGVSLRQVARHMDLSAPYLSDLERGRRAWTESRAMEFIAAVRAIATTR